MKMRTEFLSALFPTKNKSVNVQFVLSQIIFIISKVRAKRYDTDFLRAESSAITE